MQNLAANTKSKPSGRQRHRHQSQRSSSRKTAARSRTHADSPNSSIYESGNITFSPLDWETDDPSTLKKLINPDNQPSTAAGNPHDDKTRVDPGFDILIACDCIYNDSLIPPFVRTCADICRLRPTYSEGSEEDSDCGPQKPTLCIIAQQLRSHEVFEEWMRATLVDFRVWRMRDEVVGSELGSGSGYVVHVLLLRDV